MRNYFIITYFILFSLILSRSFLAQNKKFPNVIVIMTDDMGNNIAGLGNPWLNTPSMDKLKNESVYLTNFHQNLMCTPSRAAIMTGKYALRTGAWRTSVGRSNMRTEEITIAEIFRENGYKTGSFGKWHLGDTWPYRSIDQGFDESVNLRCGGISQISDYWGNDYFDDTYYHNGIPQKYVGFCTDVFFDETIRFIRECKKSNDPFMIYLAPNVTHLPKIVGEEYSKPFIDKEHKRNQAIYYGMITNLDENVEKLMSSLAELGIEDDTIIIFTTDDGTAGYAAQFNKEERALENGFNLGQRGGKGSPYEGGHRLYSFVKWSGGEILAGQEIDQLTSVLDIYPTLLDLCDIKTKNKIDYDGISFKNALYGKEIPNNKNRSLVLTKLTPGKPDDFKRNKSCVIQGDWRCVNKKELYNVKNDRGQRNNIADKHPEIVENLNKKLNEFLNKNAKDRDIPVRFILGDKKHKSIDLTTQDLWSKSAFSQSHVRKLEKGSGPWKVTFKNTGKYLITLSRYPLYTNLAFNAKTNGKNSKEFSADKATLKVMDRIYEKTISPTDTQATFEVEINKGDSDLETWITASKENITVPAYFVNIKYYK